MRRARRLAAFLAAGPLLAATTADPASPKPRFVRYPLTGPGDVVELVLEHGTAGFDAILRLNRIDARYAWQGADLVVPDPMVPADSLSPFPDHVAALAGVPRALFVSLRVQAWAAYLYGRRVRWGPTSTGREETPTCPGLYYTSWKAKERVSTDNPEWLLRWYFNFETLGGCSFHAFDLPGRPASHACVRLLEADAKWIYDWAEQWLMTADERAVLRHGTPVVIFGEYDYGAVPPWNLLPEDSTACDLEPQEIDAVLALYAGGDSLASRSRDGWRITARLNSLASGLDLRELRRAAAASGAVLDRLDLLALQAVAWAPADRRVDFDSLRAAFERHGAGVRDFRVDGWGRALRMDGIASFVSSENERLFYLESLDVRGMNADSVVWARFEGLVGPRGEIGDAKAPFRLLLSSARPEPEKK